MSTGLQLLKLIALYVAFSGMVNMIVLMSSAVVVTYFVISYGIALSISQHDVTRIELSQHCNDTSTFMVLISGCSC